MSWERKGGQLVEGFTGEVMTGFAVVWLKRHCMYRSTDLGADTPNGMKSVETTFTK